MDSFTYTKVWILFRKPFFFLLFFCTRPKFCLILPKEPNRLIANQYP